MKHAYNFVDLTGKKFGKLTVLSYAGKTEHKKSLWLCICSCGNKTTAYGNNLNNGQNKSCGCLWKETIKNISTKHSFASNGKTRFYKIFSGILQRCNNKHVTNFKNYGGRGIKCLWKSFEEFRDDMYKSYLKHIKEFGVDNTSIDRTNNNGNYCKENCVWATSKQQAKNRRRRNHN